MWCYNGADVPNEMAGCDYEFELEEPKVSLQAVVQHSILATHPVFSSFSPVNRGRYLVVFAAAWIWIALCD